MTATLYVLLCLASAPTECREVETEVHMPLTACRTIGGQLAGMQWLAQQPYAEQRLFRGWRCDTGVRV